jgi:hypothetical protein
MFSVDKWSHSNSLINVQPEENVSYGNSIPRNFDVWYVEENFRIDEKCSSVGGRKKIGVDRPRPSQFRKNFQRVNVQIEKSAWTGLGKSKKASSAASVFKSSSRLVTWGSPKRSALRWPALDKRCSSCYTLRGCVFADVQSREELKMLLQAKRQTGYKIPGRVDDRAYWF